MAVQCTKHHNNDKKKKVVFAFSVANKKIPRKNAL